MGNNSFKVSKFRNTHSKIFENFSNEISEIAVVLCVSLMELKADPSGVSLRPLACRDGGF